MEVIVVLVIAAGILVVAIMALGSLFGRGRGTDELRGERGSDIGPGSGMGGEPVRDRPAGPGSEPQDPGQAGGQLHPPEQRGEPTDETALPSDAAGKQEPRDPDEPR